MTGRRWLIAVLTLIAISAGCTQQETPTPLPSATPIPAIAINPVDGSARASGEIVPARVAALGFPAGGRLRTLEVEVGDRVATDALLAQLDAVAAEATVAQARAALLRTEALLAELQAGARPQEIAAAQARLETVQAHLTQLNEGARAEEIAAAEANLAAAEARLQQLFSGPREAERIQAQAALSNAEAARQQAQAAYDQVAWRSDVGTLAESRQLQEATNNYEAAQARYDALFADPDADDAAAVRAEIQQAQAALDGLQASATAGQIAEAEAQVRAAQAELDLLAAGARAESITVAQAVVAEAEAAVQRAEADLANSQLRAPFSGTISALEGNPGEMVLPGQTVLTVADLEHLQAETTDLSERDVGRVSVDKPATVFVKALNSQVPGRVLRIAPQASIIGGDVVYTVVIELDGQPADLRWGMSVDVEIHEE
ncbi:MAG: HlyD family efflux transporter periplasmic adaptor subunit [Chloroflexota bacterium]|nr:HlyD family efflux transporter periplasmic adaptor subunit [Chloroflexota bacterium]